MNNDDGNKTPRLSDNPIVVAILVVGALATIIVAIPQIRADVTTVIGAVRSAYIQLIPPTQINIANPTAAPRVVVEIPTTTTQTGASSTNKEVAPLRDRSLASIGTGVFTKVEYSDGLAPYDDAWLDTQHSVIQIIRPEVNRDGCGMSIYDTGKVWFSSSAGTILSVNGRNIGKLAASTGKHGYIFDYSVHVGDQLCAVGFAASGYHIVLGPDIDFHYDSYCFRGYC